MPAERPHGRPSDSVSLTGARLSDLVVLIEGRRALTGRPHVCLTLARPGVYG